MTTNFITPTTSSSVTLATNYDTNEWASGSEENYLSEMYKKKPFDNGNDERIVIPSPLPYMISKYNFIDTFECLFKS